MIYFVRIYTLRVCLRTHKSLTHKSLKVIANATELFITLLMYQPGSVINVKHSFLNKQTKKGFYRLHSCIWYIYVLILVNIYDQGFEVKRIMSISHLIVVFINKCNGISWIWSRIIDYLILCIILCKFMYKT